MPEEEKKQRIFLDHDERKYLILVAEDGIRTTLSLQHDDGLDLLRELTLYYGKPMTVAPRAPEKRYRGWITRWWGAR